jgi:hypothetical protein
MLRKCNLTSEKRVVYKIDINITGSWEKFALSHTFKLPHGCMQSVVVVR